MPRLAKSVHSVLLMVPSGFIANEPPADEAWPVSVVEETAPSLPATPAASVLAMALALPAAPPCQPPPPSAWTREFQAAFAGSQTSMPMPGEVEGASAGPGLPGPTLSLTMQTSLAASGVAPVAVPPRMSASPFLKALTATTVVSASGLKFALSVSSQASGAALAGGGGVPVAIGRNALWLPLPPPQAVSRSAASAAGSIDGGFVFMGLHPGVCVQ